MITRPAYVTRDDVLRASDSAPSVRLLREIDRAVCSGADAVDAFTRRVFYPISGTRYFRYPERGNRSPAWRLWLDGSEIISLTSITAGGTAISTANVYLEPANAGPPYHSLELNISSSAAFAAGATPQRSIAVTGVFGFRADTQSVGTLSGSINASVTTLTVSSSAAVGPGDLLIAGTESMLVTDSAMVTTGQTLQASLTADTSAVSVSVTTGSAYSVGEVLLLDSERMEVTDVSGNTLTVTRAAQGTVLATHSGSTIYAPRSLTVTRGYAGTTAASHTNGDTLYRNLPPALISELNLAYALTSASETGGAYARPGGSGDRTAPQAGQGVGSLEYQVKTQYRRVLDGVV